MKEDPQPLDYARPAEPSARELKQRRARRMLMYFVAVLVVGLVLKIIAARWSELLRLVANLVTTVGFLGTAWWSSVLFDLGGSGSQR